MDCESWKECDNQLHKILAITSKTTVVLIVLLNKNKILSKKERIITNRLSNNHD